MSKYFSVKDQGFHRFHPYFFGFVAAICACSLFILLFLPPRTLQANALNSSGYASLGIEPAIMAAILIDAETGQVLYAYNQDHPLPCASTTKIMTSLLVLEQGDLNAFTTISEQAVHVDGTRIYLVSGESQNIENLLYATLLNSANDAATALGEYVGQGSIASFSHLMNERAKSLGAQNTNFVNPSGLTEENHYSSARDLALIAQEALKNPKFREIVATKHYSWKGAQFQTTLTNLNRLLGTFSSVEAYPGITGVKTGYTRAAQNCLVASAKRNDRELISVVLGSGGGAIWDQSATLLDYGFNNYVPISLVNAGQEITSLTVAPDKIVSVQASRSLSILSQRGRDVQPVSHLQLSENLTPPILAGTEVGQLYYSFGDQELQPIPLVISEDIVVNQEEKSMALFFIAGGLILLALFLVFIQFSRNRPQKNHRRQKSLNPLVPLDQ